MISSCTHLLDLIDVVFDRMDREDIQYCLLRDFDRLPLLSAGGEVDILVREEQLPRLVKLLTRSGFAQLPSYGYDPHSFFLAFLQENGGWLKLDVVTCLEYGKPIPVLRTKLGDHCLIHRRKAGIFFTPSPEDELFTLLLHCILDKGVFDKEKQNRLFVLCHQIQDQTYLTSLLHTYFSCDLDCLELINLIEAGYYQSLLDQKDPILAKYTKNHQVIVFLKPIVRKVFRKLNKLLTSGRPPSLMVALLATDGAGKSTLASGIRNSYYFPVKSIYMGLYQKKKMERLVLHIPGISIILQIVTLWWRYINGWFHRSRRNLVIFDRYSYDAWLSRNDQTTMKRFRRWILAHACPAPDLVFLLDAPSEVLYFRKREHDIPFLENQRQTYLSLQARYPEIQIIDATASIKEIERKVIAEIWVKIASKQANIKMDQDDLTSRKAIVLEQKKKIAYVVSRFPKLTETFILYEMIAIEQNGVSIELFPLIRERTNVIHPEAKPFIARAHFQPFLSWPILKANLYYIQRNPTEYLGVLITILKSTWGNYRLFIGTIGIFPKSVYFAFQMASEGITHIHAHFARHATTAAFVIHRLTGIPYSFTAHGSDIHCDRHMLREKVAEADFVVPISTFNEKVILDECRGQYMEKLKVIHCGVDTEQSFKPRSWEEDKKKRDFISIICIGTLHEVKGQTYLIDSCKILKESGYDIACHFVGDGPDRQALEKQAVQAGLDCVIFHGVLTRPEVTAMLQEMDIAVSPSVPARDGRREGIPIVIMEAMASGLPVVASDISGIPELVEDDRNGFLVPPRDASKLAGAIERLVLDPELRRRFGVAGREKIEKEFDLHLNAVKLAQSFFHQD